MWKEIIICGIIFFLIIGGNIITQKYTKGAVDEITEKLENLKKEILKENNEINISELDNQMNNLEEYWNKSHEKLAYFIEHDELEKVDTELTFLRSYTKQNEYTEAISHLDNGAFILHHIKDKYAFNLQNVF